MRNKEFALELAHCESESELIAILKRERLWDNEKRWHPFGDNENNWSTIGNQQGDADAALVEKLVNSIDAMLMKECLVRGINPEDSTAPQSIADALELYFGIKGGRIQDITPSERTNLAKSILLIASGKKLSGDVGGYPNLTIVDSGEGQTPQNMPSTILSINKSNKLKVPFVQGKFNMGGTGVLRFCGENNIQLIISKRCPEIKDTDNLTKEWGITVIRRERPSQGRRSSEFTYLVSEEDDILSFSADEGLDIIMQSDGTFQNMQYGMYCKLFEYKMASRLCTNINMNLYYRLSMLLPNLAYPISLIECRDYRAHTMERTLSGLNVRLSDQSASSDKSNIEEQLSGSFNIDGQKISFTIYVFSKTTPKGSEIDMSQFRADEGILITQNGQTHGNYDKRFYKRSTVGLSYLSNHLITIVDCSQIDEATREDLFMNSRDRISSSLFAKKLESNLEEYLKENDTLKQIQAERRAEDIANKLDDEKPLEDVLKSLLKSSSVLSQLFGIGNKLKNPVSFGKGLSADKYVGKYNPTFFNIVKPNRDEILQKEVQFGRKFRITFKTDAENNFFSREDYPGDYSLEQNDLACNNHGINLHDGIAVLTVSLPEDAKIGDNYNYRCIVKDTNIDIEFINEFKVTIIESTESGSGGGNKWKPEGTDDLKNTLVSKGISLPNVIEVTHEDWEKHDFTRDSALKVQRVSAEEDIFDYYIKRENICLVTELKPVAGNPDRMKLLKARYKYAMVLIGMSVIGYYYNHEDEELDEDNVGSIAEMISPIILPMIDGLGDILNEVIND
jgi:hypothetical protein